MLSEGLRMHPSTAALSPEARAVITDEIAPWVRAALPSGADRDRTLPYEIGWLLEEVVRLRDRITSLEQAVSVSC